MVEMGLWTELDKIDDWSLLPFESTKDTKGFCSDVGEGAEVISAARILSIRFEFVEVSDREHVSETSDVPGQNPFLLKPESLDSQASSSSLFNLSMCAFS